MLNELISALNQIIVFSLIPLLVYLIKFKKIKGFFFYIGLKPSNAKANLSALMAAAVLFVPILIIVMINPDFKEIMHNPESITGKFKVMGLTIESITLIIITAVFTTSLAEEIFFRGFVAKRLIALTNYQVGNLLQAFLFGALHAAIFMTISRNPLFLTVIFLFPALGAYLMVYFNEKKAAGSIFPGWIAHATANLLSYTIIGFLV